MAHYLSVAEGRERSGLRLVATVGVPGPWGEAAKALLQVKKIPFVLVRQEPGGANEELAAWTGETNGPQAVYEDERSPFVMPGRYCLDVIPCYRIARCLCQPQFGLGYGPHISVLPGFVATACCRKAKLLEVRPCFLPNILQPGGVIIPRCFYGLIIGLICFVSCQGLRHYFNSPFKLLFLRVAIRSLFLPTQGPVLVRPTLRCCRPPRHERSQV